MTEIDPGLDYVNIRDKLREKANFMESEIAKLGGSEGEGELMYSDSFEFENIRKNIDLIDPVNYSGEGNKLDPREVGCRFGVKDLPGLDLRSGGASGYNTIQESLYEESSSSLGGERPYPVEI